MLSKCSYMQLVVFIFWNLRTETEAGSERGRRQEVGGGGGGEKEAVYSFTHWCRSRGPCKNSSGYVGHLECRVTSSVCDCAGMGLSEASAPPPSSLSAPWRSAGGHASEDAGLLTAKQDLGSWPHLPRCAPRGIWGPEDAETTAAISWTLQRVFLLPYKATELGNHLN